MAAASPSSLLLPRPQTLSRLLLNGRLPSPPATRRAPSLPFWSPTRDLRRFAASSSPAPGAVEVKPKLDGETGGRSAKDKEEGLRVVLPTNESSEKLLRIRHTRLFPGSKVTIGPWIDNGFYYDFDMEPLTDKDLKRIKKEMDDAHIFCLDDQIKYEIRGVLDLTEEILLQFGFNKYEVKYCTEVVSKLNSMGVRAELCYGERLPKLIRNAEKQKVPLMAVVGPKEVETQMVTVRSRFGGELGMMTIDEFIARIQFAVSNRTSL
ncbi:hypothetical protein GW17_00022558 [Ensete ventricosum]|nr:hypothetical protein GW17_00022558 [Ensete ventricosum]